MPSPGSIDFGFRGTDTDVDDARYERYRDLRNGAASLFEFGKETDLFTVDATPSTSAIAISSTRSTTSGASCSSRFLWDSIPTNFSYLTVSPWTVGDNGTLTIDPAPRQQVQNRTAVGVPCAPGAPPASCSNPTQATAALTNRSIYNDGLADRSTSGRGATRRRSG